MISTGLRPRFLLGGFHACRILVFRFFPVGDRMRVGRYQRFVVLIFLLSFLSLTSIQSFAATVPAYNGRMNAAVGGVIQAKLGRWGFAANDPRIGATIGGVGASVTTLALGVAAGGVATVGWPALLLGALISGVVTGAVALTQDAVMKWIFNSDGTISTVGYGGPPPVDNVDPQSGFAAMTAGAGYYVVGYSGVTYTGGSAWVVINAYASAHYGSDLDSVTYTSTGSDGNVGYSIRVKSHPSGVYENTAAQYASSGAPASCSLGSYARNGVCTVSPLYKPPSADLVSSPPAPVIAALPQSELAKPLSDSMLAAAANAAWKSMQSTGLGALPWSASDPITPADVADWRASNPTMMPSLGDAIAPIAPAGASSASVGSALATGTSAAPEATPGTGDKVDLGADPNIGAPMLEQTPTAPQILAPILNLMPDLKSFAVPSHSSSCPTGSFNALNRTYTLDSHCALIESNRSLIEAAMLLVWSIASVLIVLRA